jgi:hypothetical protein
VDPKAAGAATSSLDRPLVNEEGECSLLCRGEFGRGPRGLLAGGALEAIASLWASMTARRVSEDLFLTRGLYFLFDRALFLFYVEARVL